MLSELLLRQPEDSPVPVQGNFLFQVMGQETYQMVKNESEWPMKIEN